MGRDNPALWFITHYSLLEKRCTCFCVSQGRGIKLDGVLLPSQVKVEEEAFWSDLQSDPSVIGGSSYVPLWPDVLLWAAPTTPALDLPSLIKLGGQGPAGGPGAYRVYMGPDG